MKVLTPPSNIPPSNPVAVQVGKLPHLSSKNRPSQAPPTMNKRISTPKEPNKPMIFQGFSGCFFKDLPHSQKGCR